MTSVINFRIVFSVISRILMIISGFLLVCILMALIFKDPVSPFFWPFIIALIPGIVLFLYLKDTGEQELMQHKEAYLVVALSWMIITLLGSLPFMLSGAVPGFVDAWFESVAGFTTTGSSILSRVESLPLSILFWRSLTHWIGGIGIIVLVIMVMPMFQVGSYRLFSLESSLKDKIQPRIREVGIRILIIYVTLTILETILLRLGGMGFFDSVCHSFGTVATGGFSTKNTGISGYSPYIQYVIMIFMLLAATNYVIHFSLFTRDLRKVRENDEVRIYLGIVLILGLSVTGILFFSSGRSFEQSFREAFFQVISIVSTTGFATADYLKWPSYAVFLVFLMLFLGGSMGSTAGGIKMGRHIIVFRNLKRIFRQLAEPRSVMSVKINQEVADKETVNIVMIFVLFYLGVVVIGTFLLQLFGVDLRTAASAAATTMAGIGPGIGTIGPMSNFGHLPVAGKLVLSALMLLGRLEIYTLVIIFTFPFWRR